MFDEMSNGGLVRSGYEKIHDWLNATSHEDLQRATAEAETLFRRIGITFAVYGEGGDPERLIPFDVVPRVFSEAEWKIVEKGVIQRATALNAFISDVYHDIRTHYSWSDLMKIWV